MSSITIDTRLSTQSRFPCRLLPFVWCPADGAGSGDPLPQMKLTAGTRLRIGRGQRDGERVDPRLENVVTQIFAWAGNNSTIGVEPTLVQSSQFTGRHLVQWDPEVVVHSPIGVCEELGHDANNGQRDLVDRYRLADDVRIGAEPPPPCPAREDKSAGRAGLVVILRQTSPHFGFDTEELEEVVSDERGKQ